MAEQDNLESPSSVGLDGRRTRRTVDVGGALLRLRLTVFWASIERRAVGLETPEMRREGILAMKKLIGRPPDHIEAIWRHIQG